MYVGGGNVVITIKSELLSYTEHSEDGLMARVHEKKSHGGF